MWHLLRWYEHRHSNGKLRSRNIPRLKPSLVLVCLEVNERRKEENHVAALIHDRAVAEGAADLAGEFVLDALVGRVVPLEVVVAVREVDIVLVEDGGPLEGCSCGM